jgi:hypothetical protein
VRWDKNAEPGRGEECRNELPRRRCGPWPAHDGELLRAKTHRGFPTSCTRRLVESAGVRTKSGSGHEIVNQHQRHKPAHLVSTASASDLPSPGSGGRSSFCRLRCDRRGSRKADSTISDTLMPCRAASRLSSAMTLSSMLGGKFRVARLPVQLTGAREAAAMIVTYSAINLKTKIGDGYHTFSLKNDQTCH